MSSWARSATSWNSVLLLRAQRRRVFQDAGLSPPPSFSLPLKSAQACTAQRVRGQRLWVWPLDPARSSSSDLEDGSVLVLAEVLLPSVLPRDAEHSLGLVVPNQARIFATAHLHQRTKFTQNTNQQITTTCFIFSFNKKNLHSGKPK